MPWSCFYCTYENDKDSATQCSLCGMPGKRSSQKSMLSAGDSKAKNDDNHKTAIAIDLTATSSKSPKAPSVTETKPSSRKRKLPSVTKPKEAKSKSFQEATSKASPRQRPGLAGRKIPPRPKSQQRQSTLSFASSKPSFSHGHTFLRTVVPEKVYSEEKVQGVLQKVFGLKALRPNLQPLAIRCALEGKSQMVVLATGGGKSLCYQLPACLLGGVTIVISPLLALMKDQTEALLAKGVPAFCINSSQTETENKAILERLVPSLYPKSRSTNESSSSLDHPAVLLYVTPESIQTERMRAVLKRLYKEHRLALFAVDEAHCLSSWGHDFRSSYRKLNYLRTTFPETPCMALTATATPKVIRDITNELSLQNCPLHIGSFDRPNISYEVRYKDSLENPIQELVRFVQAKHKGSNECSGIVYVHKREETSMIAKAISKKGITASAYHAGLKKADRIAVQDGWSNGTIQVAVATVAFGMGIDRHCVRYVIHWNLPKSIEGFYQEAGRAGRDGLHSDSVLFYSPSDVGKYKYLIRMQANKSKEGNDKNMQRKLEQLEEMQEYCTQMKCRRNTLIGHFGGTPVDCKKTCDVCKDPKRVEKNLRASTAIKDVRGQRQFFRGKKQPWNGQWDRPHGDYDDEEAIAKDWGDDCLMAGDLQITGPLGTDDLEDVSCVRPGFSKASDILSKYESMEGRYGEENKTASSKTRSVNIPDHLKASLKAASDFTTAKALVQKKKPPKTSQDHAQKAKEIQERLAKMQANQRKLQAQRDARSKTQSTKPPPPPPLSFGRGKR